MRISGTILQISGLLVAIAGVLFGAISFLGNRNVAFALIAGSLLGGAFLWALSEAFYALDRIAESGARSAEADERSAEALEYLTHRQRRTEQVTKLPAPDKQPATVLRSIDKS